MSFLRNLKRTVITARYLKPSQVLYRIGYVLRPVKSLKKKQFNKDINQEFSLPSAPGPESQIKIENSHFVVRILNLEKSYPSQIDWNDQTHGRLWNYNLQYADFISQKDLPLNIREELILQLYSWLFSGKLKPEPYPASLRIMNVIRFLQDNPSSLEHENQVLDGVYSELHFLSGRIEYHLSGNHLLENAFALMMGGCFLKQEKWSQTGRKILEQELKEQILDDGAHFERSPMYHSIVLFRILEMICYLPESDNFKKSLSSYASRMLAYLENMRFSNGSFAHFNDSTDGIAPPYESLLNLAETCRGVTDSKISLSESGYRRFDRPGYELIVDAEGIKPDHQPGHAHADSLSFIMHIKKQPVIVDPAISTYEHGDRRNWERSSRAHNGVTVQDENYADLWSIFRIGRRPTVTILRDGKHSLHAELVYKISSGLKIKQERLFTAKTDVVKIEDKIGTDQIATGSLHFSPSVDIESVNEHSVSLSGGTVIRFDPPVDISKFSYRYNSGFNQQEEACGISYQFKRSCIFEIIQR